MEWLLNLLFSFTASFFFAVVFDAPKKLFLPAGIVGALGWMMGRQRECCSICRWLW